MRTGDGAQLEAKLGHRFSNPDLLARALTHASAAAGAPSRSSENYQRLEFLGDRVLGLVIADALIERFPDEPEGDLSRRLARLVSRETCADVAKELALGEHLKMGGGARKVTRGVLADICESVIAAVYRDGGLEAARGLIERLWGDRIASMSGPLRDAKTELQEWAHRRGLDAPTYVEMQREGPDHRPQFEIEVSVGKIAPGRGKGGSKREAEHEAAADLLRREGVWSKA